MLCLLFYDPLQLLLKKLKLSNLDKLTRLKKKAETAQREADKAQGALDQILSYLKTEFDCKSLKEAKTLLIEIQQAEEESQKSFQQALNEFEEEWGDTLNA